MNLNIINLRKTYDYQTGNQEASVSGSQISEPGFLENDSVKPAASDYQSDSELSLAQAQRLISLYFALCTKV